MAQIGAAIGREFSHAMLAAAIASVPTLFGPVPTWTATIPLPMSAAPQKTLILLAQNSPSTDRGSRIAAGPPLTPAQLHSAPGGWEDGDYQRIEAKSEPREVDQ